MFKKFSKIKNSYDKKNILAWERKYADLKGLEYVITEKLDGANFQVIFDSAGNRSYASRNQKLGLESSFFDWQQCVLKQYEEFWDKLSEWVKYCGDAESLHVYGELFGEGVQKRINYGPGKKFLPFSIMMNGMYLDHKSARQVMKMAGIPEDWWVPVVGFVVGLENALQVEVEGRLTQIVHPSSVSEGELKGNRYVEGVVVEPYDSPLAIPSDEGESYFRLKIKSEKFCDAMKVKHKKSASLEDFKGGETWEKLKDIWTGMFNQNRLADLFSKEGKISGPEEIGKFIKLMVADVKEDFVNANKDDIINLTDKERKDIFSSAAKLTVPLLKEALSEA
jgi:Rnl2 family RNA ligase